MGRRRSWLSGWKRRIICSCWMTVTCADTPKRQDLEITGTLGILVLARERGLIDTVRPIPDRLQELRFRIAARTRETVLDLAEEQH